MSVQVKKFHAALKHGAFSATAILPGEDPIAFKELHQKLIAELAPVEALEDHFVWTIARLVGRKEHLATFRIEEMSRESKRKNLSSKCSKWKSIPRKDLGASYELVEIGEIATVDRLLQDLAVEERVDAMITRQTGFGHGGAQAYEMNGPAELLARPGRGTHRLSRRTHDRS